MLYRSRPSANVILPSHFKRKGSYQEVGSAKGVKIQYWDRDIVCMPQRNEHISNSTISYPRGRLRAYLGESGLIGKIRLNSDMTVQEVEEEVRSVFSLPMGGRRDFPFAFLQPTGVGSRTLTVPCVSSSFSWTAQQVAKLGTYKQAIYILAQDELIFPDVPEVSMHVLACMHVPPCDYT